MSPRAAHAAIRFGLGPRPGDAVPEDPRPWLLAQIRPLPPAPGPPLADWLAAIRARRMDNTNDTFQQMARGEALAWAARTLTTGAPFAERWVAFWANHLTVSRRAGVIASLVGHYEREAIRPHAFGRFEEMLLAAMRHPAMLAYLDNANSAGPGSVAARRGPRGLNENLARECLELHTVTPAAGYSQEDVGQLARLLTGWSIGRGPASNEPDGFMFRPLAHEPGSKTLLGHAFPEGEQGAVEALRFLANHPATHRALARKLARHFVADDPPPAAVAGIEAALRDSGGDLSAAARAVVAAPEAWTPLTRVRSAQDYAVAVLRALGVGEEGAPMLLGTLGRLGQPLWTAPAPIGWTEDDAEWAAPEQLMRRLDWAAEMAGRSAPRLEPVVVASTLIGPLARPATLQEVTRAGSAREAILMALACPEAHRR
jgi:uncharacterized protein (DUF1800 family)